MSSDWKMKVAIYGGKFDPPHLAHQIAIYLLNEKYGMDWVIVVPSNMHPFGYDMALFNHRFNMVEIMCDEMKGRNAVWDIESKREGRTYAIDLVRETKKLWECDFETYIVVGEDNWNTLWKWNNIDDLKKQVNFVVFGRGQTSLDWAIPLPDISSTDVRERIRSSILYDHLLPGGVTKYIKEYKLYGGIKDDCRII